MRYDNDNLLTSPQSPFFTEKSLEFINALFLELSNSNIKYALIHNCNSLEKLLESDFDIALSQNPIYAFFPLLKNHCEQHDFMIVHALHYEIPYGYYFILASRSMPHTYIHLDCIHDPYGINSYMLTTQTLLTETQNYGGLSCVNNKNKFLYLILKRIIKPGLTASQFQELADATNADVIDSCRSLITDLAGKTGVTECENLLQAHTPQAASTVLTLLGNRIRSRFRYKHPLLLCMRVIYNLVRQTRRLTTPSGFFVVIIGPDGCGKSTITSKIFDKLKRAYRNQMHFHWRPGLLPKPGLRTTHSESSAPATQSRYKGVVSYARFFYYWLDFIAGYWLKLYPTMARTTLIIGERYFPDIAVHPARYGFSTPRWLIRLMGKAVPRPNLIVFLTNSPEVIHSRKDELPVEIIREQLEAYAKEIDGWGETLVVDTSESADSVADYICRKILNKQSEITSNRLKDV